MPQYRRVYLKTKIIYKRRTAILEKLTNTETQSNLLQRFKGPIRRFPPLETLITKPYRRLGAGLKCTNKTSIVASQFSDEKFEDDTTVALGLLFLFDVVDVDGLANDLHENVASNVVKLYEDQRTQVVLLPHTSLP